MHTAFPGTEKQEATRGLGSNGVLSPTAVSKNPVRLSLINDEFGSFPSQKAWESVMV